MHFNRAIEPYYGWCSLGKQFIEYEAWFLFKRVEASKMSIELVLWEKKSWQKHASFQKRSSICTVIFSHNYKPISICTLAVHKPWKITISFQVYVAVFYCFKSLMVPLNWSRTVCSVVFATLTNDKHIMSGFSWVQNSGNLGIWKGPQRGNFLVSPGEISVACSNSLSPVTRFVPFAGESEW